MLGFFSFPCPPLHYRSATAYHFMPFARGAGWSLNGRQLACPKQIRPAICVREFQEH